MRRHLLTEHETRHNHDLFGRHELRLVVQVPRRLPIRCLATRGEVYLLLIPLRLAVGALRRRAYRLQGELARQAELAITDGQLLWIAVMVLHLELT